MTAAKTKITVRILKEGDLCPMCLNGVLVAQTHIINTITYTELVCNGVIEEVKEKKPCVFCQLNKNKK